MSNPSVATPSVEFSALDLDACAREPIHRLGLVQPWGFLLATDADGTIRHASANLADYIGRPAAAVIGQALDSLLDPAALQTIRARQSAWQDRDQTDRIFALKLLPDQPAYDVGLHLAPGEAGLLVLEAEPSVAEPHFDPITAVKHMAARLLRVGDNESLHDCAAGEVRDCLGFDRVMVYRFDADGSGEVVGEAAAAGMESFRGLHYPAGDIPAQARALYCRNWLRLIADIAAPAVPILPQTEPPLDLSSSMLRSVSQVHVEYLGNMGVIASLSISIMRGGRLWGLIACHHGQSLLPNFARRSAAELFGQLYSFFLESHERALAAQAETDARVALERFVASLRQMDDFGHNHTQILEQVRSLMPCDGVAIHSAGHTELLGTTPDAAVFEALVEALALANTTTIFAETEIARFYQPAAAHVATVAGMLVVPISSTAKDYLVFFRREMIRTVTWAGQPAKAVESGGTRLSPRASFAAWQETMRGQSLPWQDSELRTAALLQTALLHAMVRKLSSVVAVERRAARERQEMLERQELLIAELNHRVRNVLALIGALVSRSQEEAASLESFVTSVNGRIQALARAHNQLTEDHWGPVALRGMIENEFKAFLGEEEQQSVALSGPPVLVEPQALSVLALLMHELATNAVKYGALSVDYGTVVVRWRLAEDGSLLLHWLERGGPAVSMPGRRGFGSTLIERSIPFELQGAADIRYDARGLEADFTVPARYVRPKSASERAPVPLAAPVPMRKPIAVIYHGTALVVEDSVMLALDAEQILRAVGFAAVGVAGSAAMALEVLSRIGGEVSFALLDVNLGDHTSLPVAEELRRRDIPFVFASGYGQGLRLPPTLASVTTVIPKPYSQRDIAEFVGKILQPEKAAQAAAPPAPER